MKSALIGLTLAVFASAAHAELPPNALNLVTYYTVEYPDDPVPISFKYNLKSQVKRIHSVNGVTTYQGVTAIARSDAPNNPLSTTIRVTLWLENNQWHINMLIDWRAVGGGSTQIKSVSSSADFLNYKIDGTASDYRFYCEFNSKYSFCQEPARQRGSSTLILQNVPG